jgi:hypothetical protein
MKNTWIFPLIESLHLVGVALLVGTVALPKNGRNLRRWTHSGLLLVLVTGPVMFFADESRYLANPAFRVKIVLFVVALGWQFSRWRGLRGGKAVSVLLWTLVALAGRAIADFDI